VEPGPNVNNNLDAPSPQPFPSNWWISLVDCGGTGGSGNANSNMYKNRDWTCTNICTWFLAWEKMSFLSANAIELTVKIATKRFCSNAKCRKSHMKLLPSSSSSCTKSRTPKP
jgi:hypothetical protein